VHLARILEPLRKARAGLGQTRLRLRLQLEELAMLGVQMARSVKFELASRSNSSQAIATRGLAVRSRLEPQNQENATHVCACLAVHLSSASGSKVAANRSCMYSLRSMPPAEQALSYSPWLLPA